MIGLIPNVIGVKYVIKTEFFSDFISYYRKAEILENRNIGILPANTVVNDPLMMAVSIYDTVHRRHAGFSKVEEDLTGKRVRKDLKRLKTFDLDILKFHFIFWFHRFTGSGASFYPRYLADGSLNPKEHGYCNSHCEKLAELGAISGNGDVSKMREYIVNCQEPMCTSIGNQGPSLKNGNPSKYRLSMQYYFDTHAEDFIKSYIDYILNNKALFDTQIGIKDGVDFALKWHKSRGMKQWHFILTAFVMDTAEYYPRYVDPKSHCYYGKNCIRSMDLCFTKEKSDKEKGNEWYEKCMTITCETLNCNPYDVEDAFCDYIRYIKEYIPKGYEHLTVEQRKNNSTLKVNDEYPKEIQDRINVILGK